MAKFAGIIAVLLLGSLVAGAEEIHQATPVADVDGVVDPAASTLAVCPLVVVPSGFCLGGAASPEDEAACAAGVSCALAVSGMDDAHACDDAYCTAISGTSTASGSNALSLSGDAEGFAAVSLAGGDARGTFALSPLGTCNGMACVGADPAADVAAWTLAVSGSGDAVAGFAAASVGGDAMAGTAAVSVLGDADGPLAVSILGDATGTIAVSAGGEADGTLAVSGCSAPGGPCAAAASGQATADMAHDGVMLEIVRVTPRVFEVRALAEQEFFAIGDVPVKAQYASIPVALAAPASGDCAAAVDCGGFGLYLHALRADALAPGCAAPQLPTDGCFVPQTVEFIDDGTLPSFVRITLTGPPFDPGFTGAVRAVVGLADPAVEVQGYYNSAKLALPLDALDAVPETIRIP